MFYDRRLILRNGCHCVIFKVTFGWGAGWPTSLRRRYSLLRLLLNRFESQSQQRKWTLGGPLHRRCPTDPNRTSVEDQLIIPELRLYKKKEKKKGQGPLLARGKGRSDLSIVSMQ